MANYTKATNFATKDSLPSGNPNKIVKGTELNSEFDAIAVAVATKQDTLPTGIIVMWSGATNAVPTGWALCNGQNGTPDLRDRFIVGAGSSYGVGNLGGNDNVTLTENNLPQHTHTTSSSGAHTHFVAANDGNTGKSYPNTSVTSSNYVSSNAWDGASESYVFDGTSGVASIGLTNSAGAHTHTLSTFGATTPNAVDIRPKYLALAYIMKL